MPKIKYQGGVTKLVTSKIGEMNKLKFSRFIDSNLCQLRSQITKDRKEMDLVSFSSCKDFYDQTLSILSFLRYVGTPVSWTIYSDGSHTQKQIEMLTSGFEFVKVIVIDWEKTDDWKQLCKVHLTAYKEYLVDYAIQQPFGKRLFLYLNHEIKRPTLFLDADILFYDQASYIDILLKEKVRGWYLPDAEWGCLDSRYKINNQRELYQVNGGFLLFNSELTNLNEGLEFLKSLNYKYEYFSEQTVMHILLKANSFLPLDPRFFILNSADQFDFSYLYPREKMAIRHYTGPVRHKMWQRDWKWQLSLSKIDHK